MRTERITTILESVYARLEPLLPSERFYVALYDSPKNELSFTFLREKDSLRTKESDWFKRPLQKDGVLPDILITRGEAILFEKELTSRLRSEGLTYWPGIPPRSWLGVPVKVGDDVLGVMVAERAGGSFSGSDQRVLTTMARQTALAIENARLFEQIERKVENLKILNEVGQKLTRGLAKGEKEILDLIYESATSIGIDTHNWYIAFYDPDPNKPDTEKEIYGNIRFPLTLDEGNRTKIEERPARRGLTEYVIRTKKSFNPPDVKRVYQDMAQNQIDKIPLSWLGVPMLSEGQVFGVIVLRHNKRIQVYTQDDLEVMEILAGQAAVALQNLRLYEAYQKEQNQRIVFERAAVMNTMAAEFAHKMNNAAGTIPIRVKMAKDLLDISNPSDKKVNEHLEKIGFEAQSLLEAAQEIRDGIRLNEVGETVEEVNINELLQIAIGRANNTRINVQVDVDVQYLVNESLPLINVERNALLDTLTNIIKNGIESIDDKGKVSISTAKFIDSNGDEYIEIKVSDTGKGIPISELSKIFDLFYSTKGDKGLGFGLWRDKIFIRKIGGQIDVTSEVNYGTTFTICIPVSQ